MIVNGPPVIDHAHTPHLTHPTVRTMINAKSTKAQLLEYIGELQADLDIAEHRIANLQPVSFTNRLAQIREELAAAVNEMVDAIRYN
jgi:hypothetical protein